MIKNRKLIALISAIAMIFTMLSSFTFASADGQSLTLSTPEISSDGKTATVSILYSGITGGVADGDVKIQMPSTVKAVTANPSATVAVLDSNNVFTYKFALGGAATDAASGTLTTLTLTLDNQVEATDITIKEGSYIDSNEVNPTYYEIGDNLTTNTVAIPADPNVPTPKPVTTAKPGAVEEDDEPVVSPTDAPVTADKGLNFGTPETSKDGTTVTVPITYVGITGGIADGDIKIQMPDAVTAVTANPSATVAVLDSSNVFTYKFALGGAATDATSGTLTTLTLTCNPALTDDAQISFKTGSYIDSNEVTPTYYEVGTDIPASNVILKGIGGSDEPAKTSYDIPLSKAVGTTDTLNDTVTAGDSKYWIKAEVKKADGSDAVYGTDYEAEYNGTPLTKAQYNNLMNGHLGADNVKNIVGEDATIQDVINNLKFKVYDKGTSVNTAVVETATGEIQNEPKDTNATSGGGKTDTVKKPTLKVSPASKSVTVGTTVKVTTALTEVKEGGKLYVTAKGASFDAVAGSGIRIITPVTIAADAETTTAQLAADTKTEIDPNATVQFVAAIANQKVTLTYEYEGKNSDGTDAVVKPVEVVYTVKAATTGGGSGSSSSSSDDDDDDDNTGNGAIATGNNGTSGSGAITGIGFNDLGDAEWARTAINSLALRNIVSGVGEGKFAPNENVTRAQYCQMLINAIGKSNDYADTVFDDVPTDAWFYHNVAVAAQLGIVSGFGDGTFRPYDLITREQMALMTAKAMTVMGKGLSAGGDTFSDDAAISDWAKDAVYSLSNAGVINGMGDGTFAPQANATRAQAATIIYNAFVK